MSAIPHGNYAGQRLVVFGCGYIGTAVAELAIARGMTVTAITRNAEAAAALRAGGIATVVADIAGDDWYDQIGDAPEFALNCVSSGGGGPESYRRSYLEGMASILGWATSRAPIGTMVYTSSTSVYPQGDGVVVTESQDTGDRPVSLGSESIGGSGRRPRLPSAKTQPASPSPPASTSDADSRSALLRATERELADSSVACRRWFILRLAGIYGPDRHHLLDQVRSGSVTGTGEHRLNLAHRDDIAAAIWSCFVAPTSIANEIFNVADDSPARKGDVVEWLAHRLGIASPRFTGAPLARRRVLTPDRIISNEKLRRTLGWRPRFPTFREGYETMLR